MAKRGNLIFGIVVLLLVAGVIAVIVLAAMGYFKKKTPGGSGGGGSTTCFPPSITHAGFYAADRAINVSMSSSLNSACGTGYDYTLSLSKNGNTIYGNTAFITPTEGANFVNIPLPPVALESGSYTGYVSLRSNHGSSNSYNFKYTV